MANDIQLKRSSVAGKVPDAANVLVGEPVINLTDKIIFTKDGSGSVVVIGAGTTSNVTEGNNLYYTNARVYSNVISLGYITSSSLSGYATNTQLSVYATNAQVSVYATNAQLALYATNATINQVQLDANSATDTLYLTNASAKITFVRQVNQTKNIRLPNAMTLSNGVSYSVFNQGTGGLPLYSNTGVLINPTVYQNQYITATLLDNTTNSPSSWGLEYGGNSFTGAGAFVLANGPTITTSLGTTTSTLPVFPTGASTIFFGNAATLLTLGATTGNTIVRNNLSVTGNLYGVTTSNITELTNLYFTNTRVYSNVITIGYATNSNVALKANVSDLTTSNVTEGTNQYFSNARVVAALSAGQNITLDANGRINSIASGSGSSTVISEDISTGEFTDANVIHSFSLSTYRSAKYLLQLKNIAGYASGDYFLQDYTTGYSNSHTIKEIVLIHNDSNVFKHNILVTSDTDANVNYNISGGNVRLIITPTIGSMVVKGRVEKIIV